MCLGPVILGFVYELVSFDLYDRHLSSVLIFRKVFCFFLCNSNKANLKSFIL